MGWKCANQFHVTEIIDKWHSVLNIYNKL